MYYTVIKHVFDQSERAPGPTYVLIRYNTLLKLVVSRRLSSTGFLILLEDFALRDIKMAVREGSRVRHKDSYEVFAN